MNPTAPDIIIKATPMPTPIFALDQLLEDFEGMLEAKEDTVVAMDIVASGADMQEQALET